MKKIANKEEIRAKGGKCHICIIFTKARNCTCHLICLSKFDTNLVFRPCVCSLHRCDMQTVLSEVVWTLA